MFANREFSSTDAGVPKTENGKQRTEDGNQKREHGTEESRDAGSMKERFFSIFRPPSSVLRFSVAICAAVVYKIMFGRNDLVLTENIPEEEPYGPRND
jgi:hypothetical protein